MYFLLLPFSGRCFDIEQGSHGNRKYIIIDNLLVHTNVYIFGEILTSVIDIRFAQHIIDGPIEYVFNTIENA